MIKTKHYESLLLILTHTWLAPQATRCGRSDVVRMLVKRKMKEAVGQSPLFWAAQLGHVGVIEELILGGVQINVLAGGEDSESTTPLHMACQHGHMQASQALVAFGADRAATDALGRTARDVAASNGHTQIVGWLDATAGLAPFALAVGTRQLAAARYLLWSGAADPAVFDAQTLIALAADGQGGIGDEGGKGEELDALAARASPAPHQMAALVRLSLQGWAPRSHRLHGPQFRAAVLALYQTAERLKRTDRAAALPKLSAAVLPIVCMFLQRRDWAATSISTR